MAIRIYLRVSTLEQGFDQQMQDIKAYFNANRINMDDVTDIVEEHVSGGKSYEDRKFKQLLNRSKPGDYIYAASTDRLGRNFIDMMRLMEDAKKRGVIIVACKQNLSLDDDNSMAKIVLAVTAIMDEDERKRIKHRTANKKAWQREQIAKHGYFIIENGPNAGQRCTYVGSKKGHDTSAAREAAAANRLDAMILWREQSKGYNWVRTQLAKGKSRALILEEFNEMHALDPENYSTREGKPLSKGVLSKWCREMNPLAV
ncbi:recombinase family protein [uncultured Muribaculum sp.]|uniref:recombinase family protein n=1 Tax=uncultured Muribaculum sp. TaxID=1918613 RepID=UPI0025AA2E5F|nr:recombinase family protein [uncultured Muribaculum sp.]